MEERWRIAIERAREALAIYRSIGPVGYFGATMISLDIQRYDDGERTDDLLEELEGIKL